MKSLKSCLLFILLINSSALLHSQNWLWAKKNISGNDVEHNTAICNDKNGNSIIAGTTSSSVFTAGNVSVLNNSTPRCVLTKLDSTGNFTWTKLYGDDQWDKIYSVTTDTLGNIFVAGTFAGMLILDNDTLVSTGSMIFIAKFDPNGNLTWSKKFGGAVGEAPSAICADKSGNIIVTGYTYSSLLAFDQYTITNNIGTMGFIVKLNTSGSVAWAEKLATGKINSVKTDSNNNVYLGGTFQDTLVVGSTTLVSTLNNCYANCNKSFLAKYDPNGNALWAKSSQEKGCQGTAICVDVFDNVYFTGYSYWGAITFDSVVVTNILPPFTFLVKFSPNGKATWGRASKGLYALPNSISCDSSSIYLTGAANYPVAFNNDTITSDLTSGNFIFRFDLNGNSLCSSGTVRSGGSAIVSADYFNHAFLAGNFISPFLVLGADTFAAQLGQSEAFVAKLQCDAPAPVTTGIDSRLNGNQLNIAFHLFPNPNNGSFNFRSDKELIDGRLLIFNALGQQISEQKIDKGNNLIQLNAVAAGVYYFSLNAANQSNVYGKFIVK